ncbi:hypothetical protein BS50DRAFT_677032 [Corynespora cassiicola Philippines]|uniref:NACHT domain-containing protein n=1 Tax=Corynespora cassiicola Philippines TaxID=1448308 RepID=A0A2T2NQ38_CORCC|nr:hypothetical protein BS50DRAFT_677032 [Corynespora cassiicola Philippines]
MHNNPQPYASEKNLIALLELCLQELGRIYLIIDGIDECSDCDQLLRDIGNSITKPHLRLLLLGRPVHSLNRKTAQDQRLDITRESVNSDIEAYLSTSISTLMSDGYLPERNLQDIVQRLLHGANGMFLWAALMTKFLRSPALAPDEKLDIINKVSHPEGLEQLYSRILLNIAGRDSSTKSAAKKLFMWITFAQEPITVSHLYELLHNRSMASETSREMETSQEFKERIIVVCGSLVEFYLPSGGTVGLGSENGAHSINYAAKFIHLSAKEFVQSIQPVANSVTEPPILAVASISQQCLNLIMQGEAEDLTEDSKLGIYSVHYWVSHVNLELEMLSKIPVSENRGDESCKTLQMISRLLGSPRVISKWIYSYYRFRGFERHGHLLYQDLQTCLSELQKMFSLNIGKYLHTKLLQTSSTFCADIKRLAEEWGEKLVAFPQLIWDEVIPFMNSSFLYSDMSRTRVTPLMSYEPSRKNRSAQPFCKTSSLASDGKITLTLAIWPSEIFTKGSVTMDYLVLWEDNEFRDGYSTLDVFDSNWKKYTKSWKRIFGSGWIVTCEVSNFTTGSCLGIAEIPLDENTVWCAMRPCFYGVDSGRMSSPHSLFKIRISHTCQYFVIQCTVFSLEFSNGLIEWQAQTLLVEGTEAQKTYWSTERTEWTLKLDFYPDIANSVSISNCGKYITLDDRPPIEIPPEYLQLSNNTDQKVLSPVNLFALRVPNSRNTKISLLNVAKDCRLASDVNIVNVDPNGQHMVMTVQGGDTPSLQLSQNNQLKESLQLASLPLSRHFKYKIPAVWIPKSADDPVRLLVNREPREGYHSNLEKDPLFPALVERRIDVYAPLQVQGVSNSGKRPLESEESVTESPRALPAEERANFPPFPDDLRDGESSAGPSSYKRPRL